MVDVHHETVLKTYCRLWVIQQLLMAGVFGAIQAVVTSQAQTNDASSAAAKLETITNTLTPFGAYAWLALLAILFVKPRNSLLCIAQIGALIIHWLKMPFVRK